MYIGMRGTVQLSPRNRYWARYGALDIGSLRRNRSDVHFACRGIRGMNLQNLYDLGTRVFLYLEI